MPFPPRAAKRHVYAIQRFVFIEMQTDLFDRFTEQLHVSGVGRRILDAHTVGTFRARHDFFQPIGHVVARAGAMRHQTEHHRLIVISCVL